jgi:hypothetical protein
MFFGDKSKIGSLPSEEVMEEPEMDEGLMAASDEILEAVKERDSHMLVMALKNFIEICENQEESKEEDY